VDHLGHTVMFHRFCFFHGVSESPRRDRAHGPMGRRIVNNWRRRAAVGYLMGWGMSRQASPPAAISDVPYIGGLLGYRCRTPVLLLVVGIPHRGWRRLPAEPDDAAKSSGTTRAQRRLAGARNKRWRSKNMQRKRDFKKTPETG